MTDGAADGVAGAADLTVRNRCWAADAELRLMHGTGAPHRAVARFGPIVAMDMGVPQPWGIQASPGWHRVEAEHARAARQWCTERGQAHGWRLCLPEGRVGEAPWDALTPAERIPMFAADPADIAGLDPSPVTDLVLDGDPAYESVVAAYGGWMSDEALARLLVVPGDLVRPGRRFIVGTVAGRPIGCAFVWWACGTGYLSGIGVLPELRGQGYGRALTAAAARLAAAGTRDGAGPDLVWMHATAEGAALYSRMGFHLVDTEVQVGPPPAST
jgi:ribosomal protein S18 acetylase RimI-like enzyme